MTIERVPPALTAPPRDDPGTPALVELIRTEIERDGPISFARFMELALYAPGLGYYATGSDRTTRTGDYLTAPELHPIFGSTIAAQLTDMWQRLGEPGDFVLREYGAGTGALGAQIADRLAETRSPLAAALRYEPIEIEGRLPSAASSGAMVGCVLANEFLDALPVHRIRKEGGALREVRVGWASGRFVDVAEGLSDPRLAERMVARDALLEGQTIELSLAIREWLATVAREIERGYVLIVDYGLSEQDAARRATGTLRAFRAQHVSSDVLASVGRQDITAHVNLDELERDARAAALACLGRTTLSRFLLGCGIDAAYRSARAAADENWDSAVLLRAAVRRLLDSTQLGGYAVVILGRNAPSGPLCGLAYRASRPS